MYIFHIMALASPPGSPFVEDDDIGVPSPDRPVTTSAPFEASSPSTSSSSTVAELLQATALNPVSSNYFKMCSSKKNVSILRRRKMS